MLEDLLQAYQENGSNRQGRYEILRTINIDGHEVAYMEYSIPVTGDRLITSLNKRISQRVLMCECNFTEGVGWKRSEDGVTYDYTQCKCMKRSVALHLRHMELREEYVQRFLVGQYDSYRLATHLREITLDLVEKGKNGEWLEENAAASAFGGYFYIQTLASITGLFMGHLWEHIDPLLQEHLIGLDGSIITPYVAPPPPSWEEYVRLEQDGWVGIAKLPGHRQMAQEWKYEILNPEGKEALRIPGTRLFHNPVFGPDVEDVDRAKEVITLALHSCIDRKAAADLT